MSRDIEFRAWDGKKMITDIIIYDKNTIIDLDEYSHNFIDVKHIMQYTGLKDKNGVEIYEGDIVKYFNELYYVESYGCIYILKPVIVTISNGAKTHMMNNNTIGHLYEVIGNIYENEELLK